MPWVKATRANWKAVGVQGTRGRIDGIEAKTENRREVDPSGETSIASD